MYFHILRPALNLHLAGDKNWVSAASIQMSLRNAAHVHLHAAKKKGRRLEVASGEEWIWMAG